MIAIDIYDVKDDGNCYVYQNHNIPISHTLPSFKDFMLPLPDPDDTEAYATLFLQMKCEGSGQNYQSLP